MRRSAFIVLILLAPRGGQAGTLEDMELRSNVEGRIRGTAATASLHLKITVENGVAVPDGTVADLNQADEVAIAASKVRGITAVDRSRLRFEGAGDDEAIASRVTRTLYSSPQFESSTIRVDSEQGVVTLTGKITHASWRPEIRTLCGEVPGVVDVIDRLESPDVPDEKIRKVLYGIFGARAIPKFPGRVEATVTNGIVVFEGRVPYLLDKHLAERKAMEINGVREVVNHLSLDSQTSVKVVDP